MEALMILVPISLIATLLIILIGHWANRTGQYDEIEEDAFQSLLNEDIAEKDERKPTSTS